MSMIETRDELAGAFAAYLDEEHGILCGGDDVVVTRETAADYLAACREHGPVETAELLGRTVTIIPQSQRTIGERRRDLYILDAGDARLVVAM